MRMSLCFLLATLSQPLWAQSAREQAADAMKGVIGISEIMSKKNMMETVVPFKTDNPDEASMSPKDFENEMFKIRAGHSDAGRAHSATVDSALTRPDVKLGNNPLSLADEAVGASEAVTAGLFEGKSCEAAFDGQRYSATRECTRNLSNTYESCKESRLVAVDRMDTWSCIQQESKETRVCNRDVSWSCDGIQRHACKSQALSISGATWNSDRTHATMALPSAGNSSCQLNSSTFEVKIKDWLTVSRFILDYVQFNGAAQILVDGEIVWTSAASSGILQMGTRDCGKKCSRQAAYAGTKWIEDCSAMPQKADTEIDLTFAFEELGLGPSVNNQGILKVLTGATRTVNVEVRRVNTQDANILVGAELRSRCCSSFVAQTGGQC